MDQRTQHFLELQRGPCSGQRNALMARVAAVRWFDRLPRNTDPSARLADALSDHIRLLGMTPAPATLQVLSRDEGLALLRRDPQILARPQWERGMVQCFERAVRELLRGNRVDGDPLFVVTGRSVLLESTVLPVAQDRILHRLMDQRSYGLSGALAQRLLDRLLWELGAMLAWETVSDVLGPNPFTPLLTIHEEGLVLLDMNPERVLLWA